MKTKKSIPLLSIDFWNTLVDAKDHGELRKKNRTDAIRTLALSYSLPVEEEAMMQAHQAVSSRFDEEWFTYQRTMSSEKLAALYIHHLGIPATKDECKSLSVAFEKSLLAGPPPLAPGIREALEYISPYYSLAIISDTMFSPGSVIRSYLDRQQILSYFDAYSFSNETGVSKPHPKAYETALIATHTKPSNSWHIGDIQRTDILGAQNIGMKAVLYTGLSDKDKEETTADFISGKWENIADYLVSECPLQ
ncbi:HAD family hydrolase [Balneolaceae bacterium ANBcel3]|nr:HAD family hydrolase [Balneolaceae bacterium ANBcel3]